MESKKQFNSTRVVISATANEGIGSQYERVRLVDLLPTIVEGCNISSILEYPAFITKGWDNHHFGNDKIITIADKKISKLRSLYPYDHHPRFATFSSLQKNTFDLVWNFAVFHQNPVLLDEMLAHSNKYILIFTPNVLNWGAPLHWGYHLLSRTRCHHPERGRFDLMTLWGLKAFLTKRGLKTIRSGYFDAPYWPDFAFSKKELSRSFPKLFRNSKVKLPIDLLAIEKGIDKARALELKLPAWTLPVIAHHQYVLAEKS